ncbi:cyclic pyranopterin monophosphate synthase MoaC [Nannocystaceae bacterium ST9]
MSDELTHFDADGAARMVDVGDKPDTPRMARARARLAMAASTLARIEAGQIGKGDVLGVARLGGIMAAKQTSQLIPLCHPVRLTRVDIRFEIDRELPGIAVEAEVHALDRTGPEMEAMQAASAAALTIYDMCKAIDRGMRVVEVALVEKSGGKSGRWLADT